MSFVSSSGCRHAGLVAVLFALVSLTAGGGVAHVRADDAGMSLSSAARNTGNAPGSATTTPESVIGDALAGLDPSVGSPTDASDPDGGSLTRMFEQAISDLDTGKYQSAVASLRQLARGQGSVAGAATCALARLTEDGLPGVIEPDLFAAAELYNRSASLGNETAQFTMGVLAAHGVFGVPYDEARAVLFLYFAALGGSPEAQLALGYRHQMGIGVPMRCSTAVLYYELAANAAVDAIVSNQGVPPVVYQEVVDNDALEDLGGPTTEREQVIAYLENLASKGNVPVLTHLGQLYYYGTRGVSRDMTVAAQYFEEAAEQGDVAASANLGHMYLHGFGVNQDIEVAKALFEAGVQQGEPAALNGMGYIHLKGLGVEPSESKAREYFKRAMEAGPSSDHRSRGNVDATYNLGLLKMSGASKNFRRAHELFVQAANMGHPLAHHKLGQMSLHGIGTPPSCSSAVKSFKPMAQAGPVVLLFDRAYSKLTDGNYPGALLEYLRGAEMGFRRAQTNAAFLLDRGLIPADAAVADSGADSPWERFSKHPLVSWWNSFMEDPFLLGPTPPAAETQVENARGDEVPLSTQPSAPELHGPTTVTAPERPISKPERPGEPQSSHTAGGPSPSDGIPDLGGIADPESSVSSSASPSSSPSSSLKENLPSTSAGKAGSDSGSDSKSQVTSSVASEIRAMRLFRRAADQNDQAAVLRLGDFYYLGKAGSPPAPEKAAHYYRRAAEESRSSQAVFNLGYMHERGFGLPRDLHLAKRYYDEAAEKNPSAHVAVFLATTRIQVALALQAWWSASDSAEPGASPNSPAVPWWERGLSAAAGSVTSFWASLQKFVAPAAARVFMTPENFILASLVFAYFSVLYVIAVRLAYAQTMHRRRLALFAMQARRGARA